MNNRYSILRTLGEGGMACVYLAHDEVLDRDVALKVLWDNYARDEEFVERFKREARSAGSLSHPNIVQVYDRGETEDGTAYMAMECVSGGTLKDRIVREDPLSPEEAATVAIQVAGALGAAHERGVIHRDIKPHNILLSSSGEAKVTDFGIARAAAATTATRTGRVLGTANYMSPEQALGQRVDPRTDLYSLGVVLFEMLTGELPFRGDSPITVSMKHINEPPPPPKELNPDLPEGVNALVLKLLAKDPDDRYADAEDLIEDLERMKAGIPPTAVNAAGAASGRTATRPATTRQNVAAPPGDRGLTRAAPSGRRRRRRVLPWLLLALLALLLVPLGAFALFSNNSGGNGGQPPGAAKVQVPEVRGLTRQAAERRLQDAGLEVGSINQFPNETIPAGKVIAPGYEVGRSLDPGTAVNLDVSTGPAQPVTTPSASSSATSSASSSTTSSASSSASSRPAEQSTPSESGSPENPVAEPEDIPPREPQTDRPERPGRDKPGKGKPDGSKNPGQGGRGQGAGGGDEGEGGDD
ncbi:MAG: Stk1 family PASTA domain-containing Ser/Thr kinase [Rubrobacteraceae bacterium]